MRLLLPSVLLVACGDGGAAQNEASSVRTQVREQLGDVPAAVDPQIARALSNAFRAAADRALHAVVQVTVERNATLASRRQPQQIPEEFRRFFDFGGADPSQPLPPEVGTGSGVIIDTDGRVITNNHVVADAERLRVRLVDGREYTATVVGTDPNTDIAVIKLTTTTPERFASISLGNSDSLRVGDWVLALGSPLPYSSAAMAGFRAGQIILSINAQEVKTPSDVERIAATPRSG